MILIWCWIQLQVRGTQTAQGLGTPDFAAPESGKRGMQRLWTSEQMFMAWPRPCCSCCIVRVLLREEIPRDRSSTRLKRRAQSGKCSDERQSTPAKRTSTVAEFCSALEAALQVKESPAVSRRPCWRKQVETAPTRPHSWCQNEISYKKPGPAEQRLQWGRNRWVSCGYYGSSGEHQESADPADAESQ